jgi:hypothetical protein
MKDLGPKFEQDILTVILAKCKDRTKWRTFNVYIVFSKVGYFLIGMKNIINLT